MNTEERRFKLTREIISNNYTDLTNKLEDAMVNGFKIIERPTSGLIIQPGDDPKIHFLISTDMSIPEFENSLSLKVSNASVELQCLSKNHIMLLNIGNALRKRVDEIEPNKVKMNHGKICQVMYCVLELIKYSKRDFEVSDFNVDTRRLISYATESIRMARCRAHKSVENVAYGGIGVCSMVKLIDDCYDLQFTVPTSYYVEDKINDLMRFTKALSLLEDNAINEIAKYKSMREQGEHKKADKSFGPALGYICGMVHQDKELVPVCPKGDWENKVSVYFIDLMRICKSKVDSYYEAKVPLVHHKLYD